MHKNGFCRNIQKCKNFREEESTVNLQEESAVLLQETFILFYSLFFKSITVNLQKNWENKVLRIFISCNFTEKKNLVYFYCSSSSLKTSRKQNIHFCNVSLKQRVL